MAQSTKRSINELLISLFNHVMDMEAKAVITEEYSDITNRKGYINRERSEKDKRVVYILLTQKGRKAFYHHRDFHKKMIKAIVKDLNEEEMEILYRCLVNLDGFLEPGNG